MDSTMQNQHAESAASTYVYVRASSSCDAHQRRQHQGSRRPAPDVLTPQEIHILGWAGEGHSTKVIAKLVGIAPGTVKWHLASCYRKLHVGSREAAVRKAREKGMIKVTRVCEICACALGAPSR